MRQIDLDNFVLLCYSAGGTYNDYITWGHTSAIKLNINGTVNTTGLYLNSSLVVATATQLNYLSGVSAGTATASKALVLDASSNIGTINTITSNYMTINNNLFMTNGSASIKKLTLQGLVLNYGVLSIQGGNNNSYAFSATDSILYSESSYSLSPIAFEINISNANGATTTNPARIGTVSTNDLVLFSDSTERLRIISSGNVAIGKATASYKLDVNGAIKTNTCLLVGTSTDTNRLISALDGITTAGSMRHISLGTSNSTGNQAELRFCYQGSTSTSNYLGIGFYANSDILTITHGDKVGIGNTTLSQNET